QACILCRCRNRPRRAKALYELRPYLAQWSRSLPARRGSFDREMDAQTWQIPVGGRESALQSMRLGACRRQWLLWPEHRRRYTSRRYAPAQYIRDPGGTPRPWKQEESREWWSK